MTEVHADAMRVTPQNWDQGDALSHWVYLHPEDGFPEYYPDGSECPKYGKGIPSPAPLFR
jgi:hypothetical protein